jgi:hypothetical protein
VFIGVIDDLAAEIADELDAQPLHRGPMEALRAAHMAVLTRVAEQCPKTRLTGERLALILRVVYSSEALRQAAMEYRCPAALEALSRHMGVRPDDRRLELAVALFATTIVTSCHDVTDDDPAAPLGPDFIMERLQNALAEVAGFTAQLELS